MKHRDPLERTLLVLLGAAFLTAGAYTVLRGLGALGDAASDGPLASASTVRFLGEHEPWWWRAGCLGALLGVLLGLALLRRELRAVGHAPSRSMLRRQDGGTTRVDGGALTGALEAELQHLPDVGHASARLVRGGALPLLDVQLQAADDAQLGALRSAVEDHTLERFRRAVEADEITARVHLDLKVRVRRHWRRDEDLLDRLGIE
jgi:hypothetical protein